MRIVVGEDSYGSMQLTCCMAALAELSVGQDCPGYVTRLDAKPDGRWLAFVHGVVGSVRSGPWLALCDAARTAGFEVRDGR